jgi:hypothetical protein
MLSLRCATHTYKSGTHTPYGILAERFEDGNTLLMSVQAVRVGTSPLYSQCTKVELTCQLQVMCEHKCSICI